MSDDHNFYFQPQTQIEKPISVLNFENNGYDIEKFMNRFVKIGIAFCSNQSFGFNELLWFEKGKKIEW